MKIEINPKYSKIEKFIKELPEKFEKTGKTIYKGRNEIKVIEKTGIEINIKSFKIPHVINRIAYAYIRDSKAKRSYKYGMKLTKLGVNTPEPVAYLETYCKGLLNRSYYISIQHKYDFTIRDLVGFEYPDKENILRQFSRFTYEKLHQNGVLHLDYSRGNILITKNEDNYEFSIVDINRMRFEKINYDKGLRNFSQIWAGEDELEVVAREYARLNNKDEEEAVQLLIKYDEQHKAKINKKKRWKQRIRNKK